jgi:hypothetical protein
MPALRVIVRRFVDDKESDEVFFIECDNKEHANKIVSEHFEILNREIEFISIGRMPSVRMYPKCEIASVSFQYVENIKEEDNDIEKSIDIIKEIRDKVNRILKKETITINPGPSIAPPIYPQQPWYPQPLETQIVMYMAVSGETNNGHWKWEK